ncbi:MAG TPA: patatin-like phospholipase family protein [Steroidobacteraceae bacterium]|nr:patatin-like phospholipase family protein [Steroidobacteraceae bacterium]
MRAALGALALAAACAAAAGGITPPERPKVCLVLSGGGARGIAHIGVLRVLEELRVPVDCVVGTSAGAIIGGAYAAGSSPDQIETAIRAADWDRLLSDQPARALRSVYSKELERERIGSAEVGEHDGSLWLPRGVAGQYLQFYLQALVAPAGRGDFDALPIQYRAIATDFENGAMVVLDHGDLAAAIRASMSVPGAFAPVEIDGRILVDGGLVRNVGVDVARALGAERVIVVNVGTPLLKRDEIGSVLSAAEQTLAILTWQNVDTQLASLRPGDVLITPDLGAFSVTDFAGGTATIPAAERATRAAAAALAPLAVDEAAYAAWRTTQRRSRTPSRYDRVVVDTSTLKRVPPAAIRRLLGGTTNPNDAQGTINTLLGTDDFESIAATVEPGPEGSTLVLRPVEKPWGPNYLHGGAVLSSDFSSENDFLLTLDQRATWLTDRGLEWRNRASVGRIDALTSQLREPLDPARRFFVAPELELEQTLRSVYQEHDALGTFRTRRLRGAVDFGARIGNYGEISAGIESGDDAVALTTGLPVVPDLRERVAAWRGTLVVDRLDSLDFPRSGYLLSADARLARHMLGGAEVYDKLSFEAQQAFGTERTSVLLAARYQNASGGALPLGEVFSLGGFQNLSGYARDQVLAEHITFVRAVVRERLAGFAPLLPAVYGGFSLEAADIARRVDASATGRLYGLSLFVSADSALGPVYLGTGFAARGFASLYLYLGRP